MTMPRIKETSIDSIDELFFGLLPSLLHAPVLACTGFGSLIWASETTSGGRAANLECVGKSWLAYSIASTWVEESWTSEASSPLITDALG